MANNERFEVTGVVEDVIKGGKFKVKLDNGFDTVCTIAGKLRVNSIRIIPGDRVKVDLSPYDLHNGRIIYRIKNNEDISKPTNN